ncbi:hypothetical protein MgSA37_03494 [Mucilaginibacter gotjawali]|nr:glycoside hydrolase [Mucilaginibacter gotjawali]BAU55313.1 hypothetical protein MgSA37_03494 [Mucilaginibacter gotjawali]
MVLFVLYSGFARGQDSVVSVNIDLAKTYQHIDNFGASDAWSCQFIGKWPDGKKNKIADLLFSDDTLANGSPRGIALSLWRFNIGAGSAAQGAQSGIKDEWRRAESFLNADGSYDWRKQAGQVWFLKAAKARGLKQFLGFANSPPIEFTLNGKAYTSGSKTNIEPGQYAAFANYISKVVKGVERVSKVKLNYISPLNEPQWSWSDATQEGCPYNNTEIAGLARSIDSAFVKDHIQSHILLAEAGSIQYLFKAGDRPGKGNQVNDFFKPGSPNYIGNLQSVSKIVAGHSYFTTSPATTAIQMRHVLADSVAAIPGLNFWQSEYCILGDNAGEINGSKRDLGIDAALYLAKVIHTDLTTANAAAWQWWTAISAYDYKDGLIYVDKNKTDGNYYPSKMLWALGNYSRFVRPGAIRVYAAVTNQKAINKPLLVSAFKNGKNFTAVIINNNTDKVWVSLNTSDAKLVLTKSYTTSSTEELKAEKITGAKNGILVAPGSVTTITGILK